LKHVRLSRRFVSQTIAGVALATAFTGYAGVNAQVAPPPPPVPNGTPNLPSNTPQPAGTPATPLPSTAPIPSNAPTAAGGTTSPSPSPAPSRRRHRETSSAASPEPSATPTSPAFATLDGTWEVQLQYIDHTDYSYLVIHQNATGELAGVWRTSGKEYPFDGSYDGRLIRVLVKEPAGNLTWSGYVEGASDMVGTIDLGQGKADPTPFTAEHRAAAKNPFKKQGPAPAATPSPPGTGAIPPSPPGSGALPPRP